MRTRKIILLTMTMVCLVTSLCLSGCKSHKNVIKSGNTEVSGKHGTGTSTDDGNSTPGKNSQSSENIKGISFTSYAANFTCTVNDINVSGQIRILNDSVIWVSLSKVLELGRAMLTPTSARGYVKLLNKYYDGEYNDIASRWGIDVDFATLQALLTGNCPPSCSFNGQPRRNGDTVTLTATQQGGRQLEMKKDKKSQLIEEITITSPKYREQILCQYLKRENIQGQHVPVEISVNLKSRRWNKKTTLRLSKITLNNAQGFPFSIPKNYDNIAN